MMVQDVPRETRCYTSSAQNNRCTYARGPFEVTKVEQVPCDNNLTNCDEKVTIKFEPPEDTGGHAIMEYSVQAAKYRWNGSSYVPSGAYVYVASARTGSSLNITTVLGLINFQYYHFKVSAISKVGYASNFGPGRLQVYSKESDPVMPRVAAPWPPQNGRGAPGNKKAYLRWDPPLWDGGRVVSQYLLQISHMLGRGKGSWRPTMAEPAAACERLASHMRMPQCCPACAPQVHIGGLSSQDAPGDSGYPITESMPQARRHLPHFLPHLSQDEPVEMHKQRRQDRGKDILRFYFSQVLAFWRNVQWCLSIKSPSLASVS
jgi:hypothetical protein